MLMSKIPSRQYASSSTRVVCRVAAQHILRATLTSSSDFLWVRTSPSMPVTSSMSATSVAFVPMICHSFDRKTICFGATSSWSVQPRLNHRLTRNPSIRVSVSGCISTSDR